MPLLADVEFSDREIGAIASPDSIAAFLHKLGYPTGTRRIESPASYGLTEETARAIRHFELMAEDDEQVFRVLLVQVRSLTAKTRNEVVRNLGARTIDHLLIFTSDFESIEFVLIDKETKQRRGPGGALGVQIIPRSVTVQRKAPRLVEKRILRRISWTCADGWAQFEKLRSVFQSARYVEKYFTNRALFSDHYLQTRLHEDSAWKESPNQAFDDVKRVMRDARARWQGKPEQVVREELFERLWVCLGYTSHVTKTVGVDELHPDYELRGPDAQARTVAFVYRWDRWLDGADPTDPETPDENPGAAVVSALAENKARWVIVTNGKLWRLYSQNAHSRSTNFYEVDLEEALAACDETDPSEAFRYWWLFFRPQAFADDSVADQPTCWLDRVVQGSRDYAKQLGESLKKRVFLEIFPTLAQGLLHDRRGRLGLSARPSEDDLRITYEATLTLLYRLLFLLYAEARDLLPMNETAYQSASLKRIKAEIADHAGDSEAAVADKLKVYREDTTDLFDRLARLFSVMDKGDPTLNVPQYNGGLFITEPKAGTQDREHRIAAFLRDHKVPDRFLALAIDRLARDPDEKTCGLVPIDYKSLEVRHLGSIYEGLLEFKLRIAEEDLGVATEKKAEKYIPLSQVQTRSRRRGPAQAVVRKGEVYLSNDKAERKASGSYYTPDPIVEYIVEHTVGPVLAEKLDALRPELNKASQTYHRHLANARSNTGLVPDGMEPRAFAAAKCYAENKELVEKVFDLKVLDPAMGSGHFLVEAVDFVTDRLLDFLNRFPNNPVQVALAKTRGSILAALTEQGVTVDSDKLTDINLLKRHVLKRCIYGVDLNPMAVELAKVSLWLDAFTLGAPLSFLDHHLRCGNSLIGATFEDLKKATTGQLFAIDYEPLLRAIHHVLFVNEMADATAAEVHQSADQYASARRELSGYEIVLDLLVADHFVDGKLKPSKLLQEASDLDLTTRAKLLASLDQKAALLVEQVETIARRPDLRFFHWEIEFPEVFFGFAHADRRQIKHKNDIAAGTAGFDAIVGNPPYVRHEVLKPLKGLLKSCYETFDSANDLYVYFQEMEVRKLRAGGRMGMIVANKWLRAGYGRELRSFLRRVSQPLELIDFGHSPIFPDADTFPCIPIVARRGTSLSPDSALSDSETIQVCPVPRENWNEQIDLGGYVRPRRYSVPTTLLSDDGWSLEDPRLQLLLRRVTARHGTLREYVGAQTYFGIKTGLNAAFYLEQATCDALLRDDKRSAEVVQPLLRGRDIRRWVAQKPKMFQIAIESSENRRWPWSNSGSNAEAIFQASYPAVARHLHRFKQACEARSDQGQYWWELRSCAYYDRLSKPKVVLKRISYHSEVASDLSGCFVNDSTTFIATNDPYVLAVLNSSLMWWVMTRILAHKKDEALAMDSTRVDVLPIAPIPSSLRRRLDDEVRRVMDTATAYREWECQFIAALAVDLAVPDADVRFAGWLARPTAEFVARARELIKTRGHRSISDPQIEKFGMYQRAQQLRLQVEMLDAESNIESLVEDAYGLTNDERALLRRTRATRDPLDVLGDRVRGTADLTDALAQDA